MAFECRIIRRQQLAKSVIGKLSVNGAELCWTLELPWKDNKNDISCIPVGFYQGTIRTDGSKGWRIELVGVPKRGNIQIHVGNYPSDVLGCILLGTDWFYGDAVLNSQSALAKLKQAYEKAGSPSTINVSVIGNVGNIYAPKVFGMPPDIGSIPARRRH